MKRYGQYSKEIYNTGAQLNQYLPEYDFECSILQTFISIHCLMDEAISIDLGGRFSK